jgi:hypothetical protein
MSRAALIAIVMVPMFAPACGDDGNKSCGPGSAADDGLALTDGTATASYDGLTASANGDCPASDAPTGVKSVTIEGTQSGTGGGLFTVCIPRPDELGSGARTLGLDQVSGDVRIVDLGAVTGGCSYAIDRTVMPTGTVTATGVCSDATNAAGFALTFDGIVSITATCGSAAPTTTFATLTGTIAVAAAAQ